MSLNLSSLATFVCVAKHSSFTRAAEELYLTQGAVSSQIKQLENELGFQLFQKKARQSRKTHLTEEGTELLEAVDPALHNIKMRVENIRSRRLKKNQLTVSTLNSIATKWLIPRILQFQNEHPDIELRIFTSNQHVDFLHEKVDCAVRFGLGNYPGLSVTFLMDEVYLPVCSPDLLHGDYPIKDLADLEKYQLLHDDCATDRIINWKEWSRIMEVPRLDPNRGFRYGEPHFVIQAAMARQGIALARLNLVKDDLKSGLLVPLINTAIKTTYSYYFVSPKEFQDLTKVIVFRDWILRTMKEEREEAAILHDLKIISEAK